MVFVWTFGAVAGAVHVLIFAMESLWFRRAAVQRRFGVRGELPDSTRLFAFNQGFYNLFLAAGMFAGLALLATGRADAGLLLMGWNALSMLGAASVLVASSPRMWRGAVLQGGPALLLLATLLVLR